MINIQVIQGDITTLKVDAIVNAARPSLLGGGGVDGAIHTAAGPELKMACKKFKEKEPNVRLHTSGAALTQGYNLPADFVIHTVGPVFTDLPIENAIQPNLNAEVKEELLFSAYHNCLILADSYDLKTVAFPAISCGVYGCPLELGITIAYNAITQFNSKYVKKAFLVMFTDLEYDTATQVIEYLKKG